jgi:hypothetical protein
VGCRFRAAVGRRAFGSIAADTSVSTLSLRVRRHHFGAGSTSECPEDSAGEIKSRRGALRSVKRSGSLLEEDGEDQVERPRSRPVRRNQSRFYSRSLDPEGRIQLRERQPRRGTDAAHGQRLSGSGSPASGQQRRPAFGLGVGPGTRSPSPSGGACADRTVRARSARPSGRAARRLREQRGQRVHFGGLAGQEPGEPGALETLKRKSRAAHLLLHRQRKGRGPRGCACRSSDWTVTSLSGLRAEQRVAERIRRRSL